MFILFRQAKASNLYLALGFSEKVQNPNLRAVVVAKSTCRRSVRFFPLRI
jgi:hypothetical protein